MYTNPKNVTEQLMNLVERLAIEMRIVANSIKNVLTTEDWATLKTLAFRDTISLEEVNAMTPSPEEVFNSYLNQEKE